MLFFIDAVGSVFITDQLGQQIPSSLIIDVTDLISIIGIRYCRPNINLC